MRIGIVQFPGSNCERETMLAVLRAGMQPVEFLWNQDQGELSQLDGYILVGGFSYEDRSRSGIIAALDPILGAIKTESEKGKPILGICNGAQILVESGLVPGLENYKLGAALTDNKRELGGKVQGTGYYNDWVYIRLNDQHQKGAFTRSLNPQKILRVPIAHGQGRFLIPPDLLQIMQAQGMNLFQYCSADGRIDPEFPVNPNGSVNNLAAISNKAGNVLAIMPHPERTENGDAIFLSMRDYIAAGNYPRISALAYQTEATKVTPYSPQSFVHELIVELIITDNHSMSVNTELQRRGIPVELKRQIHWEIECDSANSLENILNSGILYNNRKEFKVVAEKTKTTANRSFLVRAKEDWIGRQKMQVLQNHCGIKDLKSLRHSTLWRIQAETSSDLITQQVINSRILHNPYAHDLYYY